MTKASSKNGGAPEREGIPDLLGGWNAAAAARPRKRSLAIAGHRTSISLEEPFWDALHGIAAAKGVPLAALVAAIDAARSGASLSSAIRLFVLAELTAGQNPG